MIRIALLTACCVALLNAAVAFLQAQSQLWRAPAATCEGLPPIITIPVPVPVPVRPSVQPGPET